MAVAPPDVVVPTLEIRLFGPMEVRLHGVPLPRLRSRRGYWLLALLALRAGREVERPWLAAALWPDSSEMAAFANLRNSLLDLRHALGSEADRLDSPSPHTLRLDLTGAFADVVEYDAAVSKGDPSSLAEAVALYRGALLEGCGEAWAFAERQAREHAYAEALEALAEGALSAGETAGAERYLRRAVAVDPLRESAQRALMAALAAGGNYAAGLLVYRELRLLLHRELNAEPDPETHALFRQIQEGARRRGLRSDAAREGSTSPRRYGEKDGRRELSAYSRELERMERQEASHPIRLNSREFADQTPLLKPELEPVGGAVPLDSPLYVVRPVDAAFRAAVARRDSIVLVKGARQTGKTSLLARGLAQARQDGVAVVLIDLQTLNAADLETVGQFFLALAQSLAAELELGVWPQEVWRADAGPNLNFDLFLRRQVLGAIDGPVVWGLDEVDRLFSCDFSSEVFGLFRAWHNRRYLNPASHWSRLTLAMAYATEAHLFITDLNQSPFNVGTRLELGDFTRDQVADLNDRYGCPLRDEAEVARFHELVGGQPYLVRRGLHEMAIGGVDLRALEEMADRDLGPFGDHLRRLSLSLSQNADLRETVRDVLQRRPCSTSDHFYRLRAAGVLTGETAEEARPRCRLYAQYLGRHLL